MSVLAKCSDTQVDTRNTERVIQTTLLPRRLLLYYREFYPMIVNLYEREMRRVELSCSSFTLIAYRICVFEVMLRDADVNLTLTSLIVT